MTLKRDVRVLLVTPDHSPFTEFMRVPFTSVSQNVSRLGQAVAGKNFETTKNLLEAA